MGPSLRNASRKLEDWKEMAQKVREYPALNPTSLLCVSDRYPPSIKGPDVIKAYMGQTTVVNYTSNAKV